MENDLNTQTYNPSQTIRHIFMFYYSFRLFAPQIECMSWMYELSNNLRKWVNFNKVSKFSWDIVSSLHF